MKKVFTVFLVLLFVISLPLYACKQGEPNKIIEEDDDIVIMDNLVQCETTFAEGQWKVSDEVYDSQSYNYISSQILKKNDLPLNSYWEIDKQLNCDVVLWEDYPNSSSCSTRENIIKKKSGKRYVIITEDFWDKYTSCAFNFYLDDSNSSFEAKDYIDKIKLFVPQNTSSRFNYDWNSDGVLKILTVGNSFSDDMMEFVYNIAKDIGVDDVVLGNLYYPACRLEQHYKYWTKKSDVYEYRRNSTGWWNTISRSTYEKAFETNDWDYVCFQESAQEKQTDAELYEHLTDLVSMAKEKCPNATIIWHTPWANPHAIYSQNVMSMYRDLQGAVRKIIQPTNLFEFVIPCGTAIQNMRTVQGFNSSLLLRDGWHLSLDLGRYIAGVTLVKQLTGLSIDNLSWVADAKINDHLDNIKKAVNAAVENPFMVTQIK